MRAGPLLAALPLLLAGCLSGAPGQALPADGGPQEPQGLAVLASQLLTPEGGAFEPSVEVGPDGAVYVTAAQGVSIGAESPKASRLWASRDGGATFEEARPLGRGGDGTLPFGAEGDLAVDAEGTAYFVELTVAGASVSRSADQGRTWELRSAQAFAVPGGDRAWIAAGPPGLVAVAWNQLAGEPADPGIAGAPVPAGLWVAVSTDGGRTFPVQTLLPDAGYSFMDGIAVSPDGAIAVARTPAGGVDAWLSRDGGRTFGRSAVHATANPIPLMAFADYDEAGTLYVAWVEQVDGTAHASYASSRDGRAWSAPMRVGGHGGSSVMVHLDAAGAGHVALAYYCAPGEAGAPDEVDGDWHACLADVHGADGPAPSVRLLQVTAEPVKSGPVCTGGLLGGCQGGERDLGDYLQVALAPDGSAHVAWTDDDGRRVHWAKAAAA